MEIIAVVALGTVGITVVAVTGSDGKGSGQLEVVAILAAVMTVAIIVAVVTVTSQWWWLITIGNVGCGNC